MHQKFHYEQVQRMLVISWQISTRKCYYSSKETKLFFGNKVMIISQNQPSYDKIKRKNSKFTHRDGYRIMFKSKSIQTIFKEYISMSLFKSGSPFGHVEESRFFVSTHKIAPFGIDVNKMLLSDTRN